MLLFIVRTVFITLLVIRFVKIRFEISKFFWVLIPNFVWWWGSVMNTNLDTKSKLA